VTQTSEPVGLIGLGLVGSTLVRRFRTAGFDCIGYDVSSDARALASENGASIADSPKDVAKAARRIVLSLPNSDVVEQVTEGPDGLVSDLEQDDLIIDTTTSDPERCSQLAARLSDRGVHFLDATILGSSKVIADGTSLAMVGGSEDQLERGRDILDTFASRIYHLGANGKGAEAKLIVNLVLGLNRLVLAEGLLLGQKAGVDLNAMLDVLKDGAAYSRVMDQKGDKMIAEDFTPEARLSQHLKDVGLILDMGMKQSLKLPLSALHADILRAGVEAGYADQDNSAVIKALEHYTAGK
jgi:3-hydroxyisobutyrate dehydrogenase-like beta-hydroxyacid dehydrogenase